jgi:hypothetical protein
MRRVFLFALLALPLLLHAEAAPDAIWPDGSRYYGPLRDGLPHGKGRFEARTRDVYEGEFVDGQLSGPGRFTGHDEAVYEGEFKQWLFDGQGRLRLPNGDEYQGGFAHGVYEGQGTLKYAKPRPDGRTQESGVWRQGRLDDPAERSRAALNVELALHHQRPLLEAALASLVSSEPGRINLYLLAVAGDGSQEVFRREVEFVRAQFDREFGTRGRSVALINSRHTVASAPMATVTSIRAALQAIAARMNRQNDILFLFLTSHGAKDHELRLNQNAMALRGLQPRELARLLEESGIRWKVVLVSACYAGGFIEPLGDNYTLVITAARQDRASFGCTDENEFTDFGRAYFKEALPAATSFQEAFEKAQALVEEWETKAKEERSLPQIHNPRPIADQLQRRWAQKQR